MSHYALEPVACTLRAGWEKGQVERQVGILRDHLFKPQPVFSTYDDLNIHLRNPMRGFWGPPSSLKIKPDLLIRSLKRKRRAYGISVILLTDISSTTFVFAPRVL